MCLDDEELEMFVDWQKNCYTKKEGDIGLE